MFLERCSDLLVCTQEVPGDRFFKKGSGRSKWGTRRLREFCGTSSCFVVLRRALGSICNGHPASEVVKNQVLANYKNAYFMRPLSHNPKVVGSNPTPATNSNLLICKGFIYLGQSGPIEACSDAAIPTENYPVASEHGAYLLALRGRMLALGHVFA